MKTSEISDLPEDIKRYIYEFTSVKQMMKTFGVPFGFIKKYWEEISETDINKIEKKYGKTYKI